MGAGKMLKRLQHLSRACAEVHLELVGIDDAGHMAPKDHPEITLFLVEKFLRGSV